MKKKIIKVRSYGEVNKIKMFDDFPGRIAKKIDVDNEKTYSCGDGGSLSLSRGLVSDNYVPKKKWFTWDMITFTIFLTAINLTTLIFNILMK